MKHKSTIAFISLIIIILFIPLIFSSCKGEEIKKYNGKEIAYIEYEICDFMGGATYNNKIDFGEGSVYFKRNYPYDLENSINEYQLKYTFDNSLSNDIINAFYNVGILDLDEKYKTDEAICDGGSWIFTICYKDGTQKISSGVNAGPTELFYIADDELIKITGKNFFGDW